MNSSETTDKIPAVVVHGGAGGPIASHRLSKVRDQLTQLRDRLYSKLDRGATAGEVVAQGCRALEDDPLFNAGTGSKIQADGLIRMSASLMSGDSKTFSGVINVERVKNPFDLAETLQQRSARIVDGYGGLQLARRNQMPPYDPTVSRRFEHWLENRKKQLNSEQKQKSPSPEQDTEGTIGVVAIDVDQRIVAGTSTGGRGFEQPGRVSDSGIPPGNYATEYLGVSCTGTGEDIVDEALGSRLAVRTRDLGSVDDAFGRTLEEAKSNNRRYAAVGIANTGDFCWMKTTESLLAAYRSQTVRGDTLNAGRAPMMNRPE